MTDRKDRDIEKILAATDQRPGVYRMINSHGQIIYIGKSKKLRTRLRSYFIPSLRDEKTLRMTRQVEDIETSYTDTHLEAKILEFDLIKEERPFFNRQFKRDKKLVYLSIGREGLYLDEEGGMGPFLESRRLESLIDRMSQIYLIKSEGKDLYFSYQVLAPRLDEGDKRANEKALTRIFLNGDYWENFLEILDQKMREASADLKFGLAAFYRDLIGDLSYVYEKNYRFLNIYDKLIAYRENGYYFLVYRGRLVYKTSSEKELEIQLEEVETPEGEDDFYRLEEARLVYNHILYGGEGSYRLVDGQEGGLG